MAINDNVALAKFATVAVLDLETCNLPWHNYNRTSITELCIYGFAANILKEEKYNLSSRTPGTAESESNVPDLPRVVHKLTLLLNPRMMIDQEAERITGLNNDLLEYESAFDDNAAQTVLSFLLHLQQPVCLVAHNGWSFDFPIVKKSFEKTNMELPANIVCVDSLRAFLEIDEKLQTIAPPVLPLVEKAQLQQTSKKSESTEELLEDALSENSQIDWRKFNESTPKRPPTISASNTAKRKFISDCNANLSAVDDENELPSSSRKIEMTPVRKCARRSLNFGADASPVKKKYPPRGKYKLEPMYKRVFKSESPQAHHAEADVQMLMKLLLHYGEHFMDYAEQHAMPFSKVPPL